MVSCWKFWRIKIPLSIEFVLRTPYMHCSYLTHYVIRLDKENLEYKDSAPYDRGGWFGLRYFNFELGLKLRWRRGREFDRSQISVGLMGFQGGF